MAHETGSGPQLQTNVSLKEQDLSKLMKTGKFRTPVSVQFEDFFDDDNALWTLIIETVFEKQQPLVIRGCSTHPSWNEGLFNFNGMRDALGKDRSGKVFFFHL